MKKRMLSLLMCGVLIMGSLGGCGEEKKTETKATATTPTEAPVSPTETPQTEPDVIDEEIPEVVIKEPAEPTEGMEYDEVGSTTEYNAKGKDAYVSSILSGDDSFEREHAYDIVINGMDYKVFTIISSQGIDMDDGNGYGHISYLIFTTDGSDNTLSTNDFLVGEYIGELNNVEVYESGSISSETQNKDLFIYQLEYKVLSAAGDEIIFENDFELTGSDGNIIERK